jgi:import inner membrane translocase subunit TIM16
MRLALLRTVARTSRVSAARGFAPRRAVDTMPRSALADRCLHTRTTTPLWTVVPRRASAVSAVQTRQIGGLGRIAAQVIIMVGQTTFKVFMQAVAEAKAKGGNASAEDVARNVTGRTTMQVGEALEILNLEEGAAPAAIDEAYEKMFAANDPAKGGSFYIQSKIYRAREALVQLHAPKGESE